jgi:hypothetical protein
VVKGIIFYDSPWRRDLVELFPHATKEIGDIGREIESRRGGSFFVKKVCYCKMCYDKVY